ncbi:Magnesium transporter NIPA [Streptomyces sp. Ag82_O1-12]|uniref:DMT family transporter n=1 Tax=Streptomyces sp. Ag82_O1-12 TaxID=1938854 RepID=UPI000BCA6E84|nr:MULTISPECIES: DMT family transporter [unclassified Streptomyces]SMQ20823.1 Magnesium transporter NIPA [Streptomyces sp. Ag82_O1-12]SOD49527.1 Magnesium transporter NIPA [Streptomyces sp. Ag82_G6-1]
MSALALSVLLSLVSAFAYAGGAIVQERVAESSGEQYAPLRRPGWWAAVALNGLGGLLHVVALAYGPLSLVQPLGALTIVVALPMAALFVGRKAGATAWRGAIMATVGLAGLLSLVAASDARSLDTVERVAVAVVTAGVVVALMIAARAAHRHPAVRSMLLATASGIAFGMSSVFTKTVAVDWTGGVSAADVPSLAVIGVLATAGMLLSQASYRGAGLAAPLATLTVVNPVVAAAVGITMFGETFRYGTTGTALALSCGVVAAGGLILLTTERLTHGQPAAAEGLPAAEQVSEAVGAGSTEVPARVGGTAEGVDGRPEPVAGGADAVPAGGRLMVEDVLAAGPRAGAVSAVLVPGPGTSAAVLMPGPGTSAAVLMPGPGTPAAVLVPGPGTPAVLVPESEATVLRGVQETAAEVLVPVSDSAGAARVPVPDASAAVPGPGATGVLPGPGAAGAVLAPELEKAGAVPMPGPPMPGPDAVAAAAAVVASVADASYESGEPSVAAASDDERPLSYVPFYGIPYVPLPTVDRHRMRVRS